MVDTLATVEVKSEDDLLSARQIARRLAEALGFGQHDQTRLATAVWEVVSTALLRDGATKVEYLLQSDRQPPRLLLRICCLEPGRRAAALGLAAALAHLRTLLDVLDVTQDEEGAVVLLGRDVPLRDPIGAALLQRLRREGAPRGADPAVEVRRQNEEMVRLLEELQSRQEELDRVSTELDETNRGVVALYAELDERAGDFQHANQLRDSFLRNVSHELRTPLNSILALSHLLLSHADGDLSEEQDRQIRLVEQAAHDLSDFVNDLLDLARVQAGRVSVQPDRFRVTDVFAALRGMFRPLATNPALALVFEDPDHLPELYTDETKVSQILRNFIANALKFTERGEVRVSAELEESGRIITFAVRDTGIGIAPQDQERIFEGFGQLESPLQTRVKGAGLGLPLSRRLAELLGGAVRLQSRPGVGSTFYLSVPLDYAPRPEPEAQPGRRPQT